MTAEPAAAAAVGHPAGFWHRLDDGRIQCDLCPRECRLREGQRGLCFVRRRSGDALWLTSYGRASGFAVDPIEKKPLNHFHPASTVLSFGATGCNLACRFCQNWDISKSRDMDRLLQRATPEQVAGLALRHGCRSVAFTYTDPVTFIEYVVDCAAACRERGIETVAVSAGYIHPEPADLFFSHMDAANIDLKAFSEDFYRKLCSGRLTPVLDTLVRIRERHDTWLEVTTLLIPGRNDGTEELRALCRWVVDHLGADTPLHFTAFHPDWRMRDPPPTPHATLRAAREIALESGLHFVYLGNVLDPDGSSTFCPGCGALLIARAGYATRRDQLDARGCCRRCGREIPGRW
ncbi:MAG: AmmeMemoRadiSam system radical SAM enzyme [Zetaproteobacteria bacterium]|nr:MAG: AmmeMemoRadiSam system radical SAM enzyme [Zetaproteobacteria bacterium]